MNRPRAARMPVSATAMPASYVFSLVPHRGRSDIVVSQEDLETKERRLVELEAELADPALYAVSGKARRVL